MHHQHIRPDEPPSTMISYAESVAAKSLCRKARHGAAVYLPVPRRQPMFFGGGHNDQPKGFRCTGSEACRSHCGAICEHAEARAIRHALYRFGRGVGGVGRLDLVHVKLGSDRRVMGGGPPSCVQCSRLIVDLGWIGGVWLYEAVLEDRCPHVDRLRVDCQFCQGVDCVAEGGACPAAGRGERCEHDVMERHGDIPMVDARWRRYEPEVFHRLSLQNSGIAP